jgi:type IV fimbrial biogenesis protein FimT
MALLATLATLATPGFGEYLRNCRRTATVNALSHTIHAARTLASVRGQAVRLCPSADATHCAAGRDWGQMLLIQPDGSGSEDPPLRVVPRLGAGGRQSVRSNRDSLRFAPLSAAGTTATVTICDDRGSRAARAVIVSRTGRPRTSDRDASGRQLVCP